MVILSYPHAGGRFVQEALAEGNDLVCTAGTGILLQCAAAAAAWEQIDNNPGAGLSRLALSSIRVLVRTQLACIVAAAPGRARWCELTVADPSVAQTFLRIVPATRFVCVHRACIGVISAAIAANPWGLAGPRLSGFTARYPGNSVAAAAAYWVSATEQLLAFEAANPQCTTRARYEDVRAGQHGLDGVRTALHLRRADRQASVKPSPSAEEEPQGGEIPIPEGMIPDDLHKRIDDLQARLGHPLSVGQLVGSV